MVFVLLNIQTDEHHHCINLMHVVTKKI